MALGDSAGLLFRIKADGSQAEGEIRKIQGGVLDLGASFGKLTAAAAIGDLIGQALTKMADVAVRTAVAVAQLTVAAAEYGSKILEASQKTGLTTETISALKYAADQSGSSLEQISNSIAKFSTLLGQAATGNEKAQKTLALYGVTAKDTDTALAQAITTIAQMTDTTTRSAAAAALFKDRTGEILPVIESFDGDLPALMDKLRNLGLLMSNEDARAADEFADTLGDLEKQAAALGRQFATELMPKMTNAMNAISRAMADNKGVAAEWGKFVIDTATAVEFIMVSVGNSINNVLAAITLGLIRQQSAWGPWASAARVAIASLTGGLTEILWALSKIGAWLNQKTPSIADIRMGDDTNTMPDIFKPPPGGGGGGGGRGGGGSAADDAEAERKKALAADEKDNQQRLASWRAYLAEQQADLELNRSLNLVTEAEYIEKTGALRYKALAFEKQLLEMELADVRRTEEEKHDIRVKLQVLNYKIGTEEKKLSKEIVELVNKEIDATNKLIEAEKKRLQAIKDRRAEKDKEFFDEELRKKKQARLDILAPFPGDDEILNPFEKMKDWVTDIGPDGLLMQSIGQFAQGIGNLVQQFVLLGNVGPNAMKKLVASVLASVAAQAAVQAIMFTAYGIAALTPWGAAIYGPAAPWFKAAALMAVVAATAGIAGRAVAGDSFNQASGQATGQGSGQQQQQNNYTTQFQGFGQQQTRANERMIEVLGAVEEATHQLHNKLMRTTPGELVALGAGDASREIREAYHSELAGDVRTTDGMMRNSGQVR